MSKCEHCERWEKAVEIAEKYAIKCRDELLHSPWWFFSKKFQQQVDAWNSLTDILSAPLWEPMHKQHEADINRMEANIKQLEERLKLHSLITEDEDG